MEADPYAYFSYLKRTKGGDTCNLSLLSEINLNKLNRIKSSEYYDLMSFKTYVCELVYNGINLFPDICEYTIISKNEIGTSSLKFSVYNEIMDDCHPCMGRFTSYELEEVYSLNLNNIANFYCNNRHVDVDVDVINALITLMYMSGSLPKLSTSYKINPCYLKKTLNFKKW